MQLDPVQQNCIPKLLINQQKNSLPDTCPNICMSIQTHRKTESKNMT